MLKNKRKPIIRYTIIQFVPNMLTIIAMWIGFSAIRFGIEEEYQIAAKLIVVACILDGLDGKVARFLGSDSKIGAELDTLADFLNFGVAPSLIIYLWALSDTGITGWVCALIFGTLCMLRLARFNVSHKSDCFDQVPDGFFVGFPSPAGAMLALLPMFASFAFSNWIVLSDFLICLNMLVIGLVMISSVPTWSPKALKISNVHVMYLILGFVVTGVALITHPWVTFMTVMSGYVIVVTGYLCVSQIGRIGKK